VASYPQTQLAAEALADMAMSAVAPQGLDSTEVAPAASVQQLDANGVSGQAIHPHGATQPISTSARSNAAATTLKQKFETFVMCDFTPRHPDDLPLSQWVSYDTLLQLFQPHAPLHVWRKGPGNLKQLIIEWYQGDPTFSGLAPSAWCKARVIRKQRTDYFALSTGRMVSQRYD